MPAIVSRSGRITIPKAVRNFLRLRPGSVIDFELAGDGRAILKVVRKRRRSVFASLRGTAKNGLTTEQIMALTRGTSR
jgi:AbrB family looped-hinge helix DNA binding protein